MATDTIQESDYAGSNQVIVLVEVERCASFLKDLVVLDILEGALLRMTPGFLLNNWKTWDASNWDGEDYR